MAERSLRDRLVELRRPGATPPAAASGAAAAAPPPPELQAPASLDELEVRLLGATGDGLPLKERLERLVGAATARDRARTPPPQRLSEIVRGDRVANERGEFFQMEHSLHVESLHGGVSLSRLRSVSPSTVAILAGEPGFEAFELGGSAFLDTETTGLSGGAGTAAFLVGLGFVDGDAFRVRQYFMEDYDQEAALLHQLAADLRRFPRLVTFNGKMFDVPLLETRYRLSRGRWPLEDAPHLDLLHPARRLWKARLESCRLVHLETELLRLRREEDIPGDQIPQVYFDYLRSRDARVLPRIFEHNRLDVVSLAALAVLACQWVESGHMDDPRDAYSLARVFDRAELRERSEAHYRAAAERGEGAVRVRSLLEPLGPAAPVTSMPPWRIGRLPSTRARRTRHGSSPSTSSIGRETWKRRSASRSKASRWRQTARWPCSRISSRGGSGSRAGSSAGARGQGISERRKSTISWMTTGLVKTAAPERWASESKGERV
jgi:uncharacterized protein YprB with RNaseH-like and TPR domain